MEIIVDCDGQEVKYINGEFYIPESLQKTFKQNLILRVQERILQPDGEFYRVGTKTPTEILALFYSLAPGRSYLIKGPEELSELFK